MRLRAGEQPAPDLQCAGAHEYKNFLATPAHSLEKADLRLIMQKSGERANDGRVTCAGFTMRGSAWIQKFPCNTGAQFREGGLAANNAEKRREGKRRESNLRRIAGARGARCGAMEAEAETPKSRLQGEFAP